MGFDCELTHIYEMSYEVKFDNGIIENEYDHVYIGRYEKDPEVNPEEVQSFRWISLPDLMAEMEDEPEKYTFWFKKIMKEFDFTAIL